MSEQLHNLSYKPDNFINIDNPFDGDVLKRKELAQKMTSYLPRLKAGAVLAIDAPWGEGKTWFGRHWETYLKSAGQDYRTIYIDAFENDYVEDPFLLIATEIAQLIKQHQTINQDFIAASASVMKAILPLATSSILNLIAVITIGKIGLSDDIKDVFDNLKENSIESIDEWIQEKFDNHESEKNSVTKFTDELKKFAASQEKPIVIFIDELDRCRPDFAIKLIERIKHFFNVENVVFILLLNRDQLHNAIKGVYGSKTDAANYLGKFINFFFSLPKLEHSDNGRSDTYKFILKEFDNYHNLSIYGDIFYHVVTAFDLSLRDIQKALSLYVFSNIERNNNFLDIFVMYAACLKIKHLDFYNNLKRNSTASTELIKLLLIGQKNFQGAGGYRNIFTNLIEWHKYIEDTDISLTNSQEIFKKYPNMDIFLDYYHSKDIKNLFIKASRLIDISID